MEERVIITTNVPEIAEGPHTVELSPFLFDARENHDRFKSTHTRTAVLEPKRNNNSLEVRGALNFLELSRRGWLSQSRAPRDKRP